MERLKSEKVEERFFQEDYPTKKYLAATLFFFALAFIAAEFFHADGDPSFHKEIFPTTSISYIKDGKPVTLADGTYALAMPAGGTFVNGIAPMLMIKVDGEYYPLNIADDSILPRQGKLLPLKILFGFTSPHAHNKLKYDEKKHDNPVEDYRKKARYYLHVKDGFGDVVRMYYTPR